MLHRGYGLITQEIGVMLCMKIPVDTGRKLNVHKTFRRRPGRLLNILSTFNLRPVSTGILLHENYDKHKYFNRVTKWIARPFRLVNNTDLAIANKWISTILVR